jgi:hypothetical protein
MRECKAGSFKTTKKYQNCIDAMAVPSIARDQALRLLDIRVSPEFVDTTSICSAGRYACTGAAAPWQPCTCISSCPEVNTNPLAILFGTGAFSSVSLCTVQVDEVLFLKSCPVHTRDFVLRDRLT